MRPPTSVSMSTFGMSRAVRSAAALGIAMLAACTLLLLLGAVAPIQNGHSSSLQSIHRLRRHALNTIHLHRVLTSESSSGSDDASGDVGSGVGSVVGSDHLGHYVISFLTSSNQQLFRNIAYVWYSWHFVISCICVFVNLYLCI